MEEYANENDDVTSRAQGALTALWDENWMKFMVDGAARTHTGRVRSNNEDNFYLQGRYREDVEQGEDEAVCRASDRRFLAAVADGMGGEEQGRRLP